MVCLGSASSVLKYALYGPEPPVPSVALYYRIVSVIRLSYVISYSNLSHSAKSCKTGINVFVAVR
jgi:hypothetical protein